MQLYPNPSTGIINVDFTTTTSESTTITVTDMAGRVITSKPVTTIAGNNHTQLDLSRVAKGVYMVKLGSISHTAKSRIVIE